MFFSSRAFCLRCNCRIPSISLISLATISTTSSINCISSSSGILLEKGSSRIIHPLYLLPSDDNGTQARHPVSHLPSERASILLSKLVIRELLIRCSFGTDAISIFPIPASFLSISISASEYPVCPIFTILPLSSMSINNAFLKSSASLMHVQAIFKTSSIFSTKRKLSKRRSLSFPRISFVFRSVISYAIIMAQRSSFPKWLKGCISVMYHRHLPLKNVLDSSDKFSPESITCLIFFSCRSPISLGNKSHIVIPINLSASISRAFAEELFANKKIPS